MTANWFDGRSLYPPTTPGTAAERHQARRAAAQLTVRNDGTAEDLRTLLDALALWPDGDHTPPADTIVRATRTKRATSIDGR